MAPASAAVPTKIPTSEIGVVTTQGRTGWQSRGYPDDGEETAALAYPESVRTFDRMRRSGPVHTVLTAVTHPVRRSGIFVIDPQGADPARVALLAEDLDLPIIGQERPPPLRRRGRFSWLEHVRLALLELVYGHMGFELVCDPEALESTGMARLKKLAPRFPASISGIDVEADGGLKGIRQWRDLSTGSRLGTEISIPVANLVWYANEREGAAWQGRSILRPCYGSWLRLDRMLRARAYLMERQSMGLPTGEAPEGADQTVIDRMGELAMQARAGDQSGIGLPHGARIRLVGVEGTLPDINAAIADERASLADSVMASWLRLGTAESSGNRALGQTFVDQFTQSEDSIAGQIADVATQYLLEDLWDLNYGETDPAPCIVAQPIDAERDIDPAQLVELIKVGAITPDESIEDFLRKKGKLPARLGPRPSAPPPMPDEPPPLSIAAARRTTNHGASVMAAAKTWTDRVADTLASLVDMEAIATAVESGTAPAEAVAAGLSKDDTKAVAALLTDLWGEGYGAGTKQATEAVPASTAAARRPAVVMASLMDVVSAAGEIAAGIVSSMFDRLVSAVTSTDVPNERPKLMEYLNRSAVTEADAERIAATEYHRSVTAGAVDTWLGMGITETEWVRASGSAESDECQARSGTTSKDWDGLPPLHPNCFPGSVLVSGPRPTASMTRWYEGELVEVRWLGGGLSATPNHPVLTDRGWVAVGQLVKGDQLVGEGFSKAVRAGNPHDDQPPALIGEVAHALRKAGGVAARTVPVAAEDFHGDGRGSEVYVVGADRPLRREVQATIPAPVVDRDLVLVHLRRALDAESTTGEDLRSLSLATQGGVGGGGSGQALLGRSSGSADPLGFGSTALLDASRSEATIHQAPTDAVGEGQSEDRFPVSVPLHQLVSVERHPFTGHVYNLQTGTGWYHANGIIVSNCACLLLPVLP